MIHVVWKGVIFTLLEIFTREMRVELKFKYMEAGLSIYFLFALNVHLKYIYWRLRIT